jgi:hypothetical protein
MGGTHRPLLLFRRDTEPAKRLHQAPSREGFWSRYLPTRSAERETIADRHKPPRGLMPILRKF